jgi:GNAT superfamily N-acetyltransferase
VDLRLATTADAETMAETVAGAFDGYRAFAPPGWEPPDLATEVPEFRARLADPTTWCLMGWEGARPAGHVAFIPASLSRRPENVPSTLAHLWHLFVRDPWWGTGLASALLGRAVDEAAARGFDEMRLGTPAGQARARRFYEREGWRLSAAAELVAGLGLELVEYRRPLAP